MENDITDTRREPRETAGAAETLTAFLDYFRATVVMKASGLSDSDGAKRLLPSLTTVSGLVRHLADVERHWFRNRMDGQHGVPARWTAGDPDAEFKVADGESLAAIIEDYEAACRESRDVLARYALDERCRGGGGAQSVRWVVVHMIEETGRHCGHLDILRELLDGTTGD